NPSSIHQFADGVARGIKHARQQVQHLLGCEHDSEIIFTSCGTEANNTAIHPPSINLPMVWRVVLSMPVSRFRR
ncbi:MAG: aminotransferase class V-fold PLP-dependent enzyme, partial [Methylococcaceae bacterium]|nr:aminotransferase class V-fold PLP-dependent enzyme [Methylococcaceae bacterium]